jgi:hypothetical protein
MSAKYNLNPENPKNQAAMGWITKWPKAIKLTQKKHEFRQMHS